MAENDHEEEGGGTVSRGALTISSQQSALLRSQASRDVRALATAPRSMWTEAGPDGLNPSAALAGSPQGSQPIGGMVMDVVIDPDALLAATTEGGVWKSVTDGAHWIPLTDRLPALSTGALATGSAVTGRVLVAGTSDPYDDMWTTPRAGLYRSVDDGKTWAIVDGGESATRFLTRDVNWIRMIDLRRILIATDAGLFYSEDGGYNFGNDEHARNGQPIKNGNVTALRLDSVDGTQRALFALYGDGIWSVVIPVSGTPHDATSLRTARATVDHDGVGGIAFDHVRPDGVEHWLMSVATPNAQEGQHHSVQYGHGDGTGDWDAVPDLTSINRADSDPNTNNQPQTDYDHTVGLDPTYFGAEDAFAYVGAVELTGARIDEHPPGHHRPIGDHFDVLAQGVLHDDQHVIVFDPSHTVAFEGGNVSRVYVGNDGGLYRSDNPFDPSPAWEGLSRMRTALFYALAAEQRPGGGYWVAGGMQDKGTAFGSTTLAAPSDPTSWTWDQIGGGDGGTVSIHPVPAGHASGWDVVVFLWENDYLARAEHAAAGWTKTSMILSPPKGVNFSGVLARARGADHQFSVVYAATGKDNSGGGSTLKRCDGVFAAPLAAAGFIALPDSVSRITALAAAPDDAQRDAQADPPEWTELWVGLINGKIFYSHDKGAHLEERSPGVGLPVSAIAVDPSNSDRVVVAYGGFSKTLVKYKTKHVWLTEDRGRHWRDISGVDGQPATNLPDAPALSIAHSNTTPKLIAVGTSVGVLVTRDDGQTWRRLGRFYRTGDVSGNIGNDFPAVDVFGLAMLDNRIGAPQALADDQVVPMAAATYGRGLLFHNPGPDIHLDLELDGAFGAVRVGQTREQRVRFVNRGVTAVDVTNATLPAGAFSFQGLPTFPAHVAGGGSVEWTVRCSPGSEGIVTADARIETSLGFTADLSPSFSAEGVTFAVPRLSVNPGPLIAFGPIPSSADPRDIDVTLSNTGTDTLEITGIDRNVAAINPDHLLQITPTIDTPRRLEPGEQMQINVRFDPGTAIWPEFEATLVIHSNDPTGDREITVTGGASPPEWVSVTGTVLLVLGIGALVVAAAVGITLAVENSQQHH